MGMQSLERQAEIAFAAFIKTSLNVTLNPDDSVPEWLKRTHIYRGVVGGFMEMPEDLRGIPKDFLNVYESARNIGKKLREDYEELRLHHP